MNSFEKIEHIVELYKEGHISQEKAMCAIIPLTKEKKSRGYELSFKEDKSVKRKRRTKRGNKRWTKEEIDRLKTLNEEGKSYKRISKELGRTYNAVRVKLHKLKISYVEKPHNKKIYKHNPKMMPVWKPEEYRKLIDMAGRDMPVGEIAKLLNRSCHAVECRLSIIRKKAKNGGMTKWRERYEDKKVEGTDK